MVKSRDAARLAGVSQSTVSYVMSGRRSIWTEGRFRVAVCPSSDCVRTGRPRPPHPRHQPLAGTQGRLAP
ncbi:LacI family DNA-binding transcriptional regulator [Streptomyces sp. NPDC059850]|uniref:LacI family DNA-binding transcriptional regulator n=1 Tax=Streptomyces sp. NPDC059850 TaxID=3346970 RepID=UPI0036591A51